MATKMDQNLGQILPSRKAGPERFHASGTDLGFDLLSFWRWANSDLMVNTSRGIVAEFLVARALGLGVESVRNDWGPYDLATSSGLKIEVKSSAFLQAWRCRGLSKPVFSIAARRAWDRASPTLSPQAQRHADLYVFALLAHKKKETADPMNVDQWRFYVVPTALLSERHLRQKSITLTSVEKYSPALRYAELAAAVEAAVPRIVGQVREIS